MVFQNVSQCVTKELPSDLVSTPGFELFYMTGFFAMFSLICLQFHEDILKTSSIEVVATDRDHCITAEWQRKRRTDICELALRTI